MSGTARVLRLPYGQDPLRGLAHALLEGHPDDLPHTHVLLPASAHGALRNRLQRVAEAHGREALLGPRLATLRDYVLAHTRPAGVPLGAGARELLLVEALRPHAALFNHGNPWALAEALAQLFDELTLHHFRPPDDLTTFRERLARAYGSDRPLAPLEREARLIHTLWQAYHQQLSGLGRLDDATDYAARLAHLHRDAPPGPLLIVADPTWCAAEREAVARLLQRPEARLAVHGDRHDPTPGQPEAPMSRLIEALHLDPPADADPTPRGRLLHACYGHHPDHPLARRAARLAERLPHSPLAGETHILQAGDPEQEARACALQLRLWQAEGHTRLAVVTEDRRLARRLRALLDRHGIPLRDAAGWALSTTAAASALERLLQCVEEDFPHQALLDLLQSPFLGLDEDPARHRALVHRLERDVVRQENIARGLSRYLRALDARERRYRHPFEDYHALRRLLQDLDRHTAPLARLRRGEHLASRILERLRQTLDALGMSDALGADPAGRRLLEELDDLTEAARVQPLRLRWNEFRAWLGRTLERYNFTPPPASGGVLLLNHAGAALQHFDGLIVCGLTLSNRPRPPEAPFLNQRVRAQLGLADPRETHDLALHQFVRNLHGAPRLLLTSAPAQADAPEPEPWLEQLQRFHQRAWGDDLAPTALARWSARPYPALAGPRPAPIQDLVRASLRRTRLPQGLSASAHQALIDCPYRYYASEGLRLTAPEAVREAMAKSDYGELVHRCLEAFHQGLPGLPGPYPGPWDEAHREKAIATLEAISEAVFAPELADSFAHRHWLLRWRRHIPGYVDWHRKRLDEGWEPEAMETRLQRPLAGSAVHIQGRLDRIDRRDGQRAVIDFKTGDPPGKAATASGEAVQLPHYVLTAGGAAQALYLALDKPHGQVTEAAALEGAALEELCAAVEARLQAVLADLEAGAPLPAWGDSASCRHCPFPGVCRRPQWDG